MRYQQLGTSGLTVSVIGLGGNNFGVRCGQEQTIDVVRGALDAGITLFDTAPAYGGADGSETAAYKGFGIGMPGNFGALDATSGLATGAFGIANPFTGFKSDTYSQLVQAAASELDLAKRKDLYAKINDLIPDECFTMTLSSFLQSSATTTRVHNIFRQPVGGYLSLKDTWME